MASTRTTTGLALGRGYSRTCRSPSSLINSVFASTVNTAARTLVSIASTEQAGEKWRAMDHFRFMFMLMTWLTLWVLRVLMDYFPSLSTTSGAGSPRIPQLQRGSHQPPPLLMPSSLPTSEGPSPPNYLDMSALALVPAAAANSQALDMILYEGGQEHIEPSVDALGRALSHILALLSEIPASSRKYQFAMAMAERIMEENAREGHVELLHINRTALSSAFAHTSTLLYRTLHQHQTRASGGRGHSNSSWPGLQLMVRSLPMGNYVASYVNGVTAVLRFARNAGASLLQQQQMMAHGRLGGGGSDKLAADEYERLEVAAEKLAQELLWITTKMRDYGAVNEALEQWSFSSALASASLSANPTVQGLLLKIFAILFGELAQSGEVEVYTREVKLGLLGLWLPLCCHASTAMSYPLLLTAMEKAQVERGMEGVIATLPPSDQELLLTNWFQDFTSSASDWPNLQASYQQWCHSTRKLV